MQKLKMILALVMLLALVPIKAQTLQILTEEDPPYSFTGDDKKPAGYAVEIVNEIQKRTKSNDPVQILPWARAYKYGLENPNTVVFTMSRTVERENLFQWVGPIVENDWVFVGKKSDKIKLSNLEDAKKLKSIGSVNEYAWTKYLLSKSFNNIDAIAQRKQNVLKLEAGRVQAFVSADCSYKSEISENGFNPDDYEILLRFNKVQMYYAFSKSTDKKIVDNWQKAYESIKKDGTLATLLKKWLPENKMPGAARPGTL